MQQVQPGEKEYLATLSGFHCLSLEKPVLDGAALVFQVIAPPVRAELLVEVRLPGYRKSRTNGLLMAFLQNVADVPLDISAPEFILTGGLRLPWKVGITILTNPFRGETGEALAWQVQFVGNEDPEVVAEDVSRILGKSNAIAQSSAE